MRDAINNNPVAQIAIVAVLLVAAGFFVMSSMGGGAEESGEEASVSSTEVTSEPALAPTATGVPSAPGAAAGAPKVPVRPLPPRIVSAFDANRTVVLMIVKRGAVDDAVATASVLVGTAGLARVSMFVVPVDRIAHYTAITQGVELSQVPALVVVRPKNLDHGIASASVSYGYQSPESVRQAIMDARYKGRTLSYHP